MSWSDIKRGGARDVVLRQRHDVAGFCVCHPFLMGLCFITFYGWEFESLGTRLKVSRRQQIEHRQSQAR